MLTTLLVTLREGIEAFLVVAMTVRDRMETALVASTPILEQGSRILLAGAMPGVAFDTGLRYATAERCGPDGVHGERRTCLMLVIPVSGLAFAWRQDCGAGAVPMARAV